MQVIERILHMLRVKDCRHVCLFCEYYDMCKQEIGSRNKQEAVKLKQMGVKAGVSDLCLPYPKGIYCGLYIEMKFGDNRQQVSQKEFLKDMAEAGHFVATCYSAEEAIEVIKKYLSLNSWRMNDVMIVMGRASGKQDAIEKMVMDIPNNSILKNGEIKESKPRKK